MEKQKHRLQFDVTDNFLRELDDLKTRSGGSSRAGVVRSALRFYFWVVTQKEQGNEILVKQGEETTKVEFMF